MKLNLTIDPSIAETVVAVRASEIDDEVRAIQDLVLGTSSQRVIGMRGSEAIVLDMCSILAFFTKDKTVYAHTIRGDWRVKPRLYELEAILPNSDFVRISKSEIVNISAISRLDLSISATICVLLKDGTRYYVSRRQLKAFKTTLGL